MLRLVLVLVALTALAPVAQAQRGSDLIYGDDTRAILDIARRAGSADMDRGGDRRDPAISGRMDNLKYSILFSGCSNSGRDCRYIQMIASFELPRGFSERDMNEWNKTRIFGKAFINNSRDAVLSLNFSVAGGVSQENFSHTFGQFRVFLKEFNDFLYGKRRR